jgi:hypothetical protein
VRYIVMNTETFEHVLGFETSSREMAERHAAKLTINRGKPYAMRRLTPTCDAEACDCYDVEDVCGYLYR